MNIFRKRYRQFRAWQLKPFRYRNKSKGVVRCANCGNEVTANFCPICGQRARVGRICWAAAWQSVLLLWGLDTRSLSYTLVQLLLRPGYLISDYIRGHRQVSFPPVKMLFIVAIAIVLLDTLFPTSKPQPTSADSADFLSQFSHWLDENPGWLMLLTTISMLLPTWFVFRWAPRHTRHTLPEGFFIQVFMATILGLIEVMVTLSPWFFLLFPAYYVVTYRRLFGYRIWGTLWRMVACILLVAHEVYFFVVIVQIFQREIPEIYDHPVLHFLVIAFNVLLILLVVGVISLYTARKTKVSKA